MGQYVIIVSSKQLLITNVLLAILLMTGQLSLLAHDALHSLDPTSEKICTLCLHSPLFDGAPLPSTYIAEFKQADATLLTLTSQHILPEFFNRPIQPRAPPVSPEI